jgi:tetratricopeptide (TPR) repeat protein
MLKRTKEEKPWEKGKAAEPASRGNGLEWLEKGDRSMESLRLCPHCETLNPPGVEACEVCGRRLPPPAHGENPLLGRVEGILASARDERAARALIDKADALMEEKEYDPDTVMSVYADVVRHFGEDDSPNMRYWVGRALLGIARVLWIQDQPDAARAVYDEIVSNSGNGSPPGDVIKVFVSEVHTLNKLGRHDTAMVVCDEFARRFSEEVSPDVRSFVISALCYKASVLEALGEYDAAMAVHDEIDRRFGEDSSPDVRSRVVSTLCNKAKALKGRGEYDAAMAVHDEIDRRFGEDSLPDVRSCLVSALRDKAMILRRKPGNHNAAMAVYDEIDRRFGKDGSPDVRSRVVSALRHKARALSDNRDAVEAVYGEIVRRFGVDDSPDVRAEVADALYDKGSCFLEEPDARIDVYNEIIRRFGDDRSPSTSMRLTIAFTLERKSEILEEQGKYDAAIAACDEIDRRFGKADSFYSKKVGEALLHKANILEKQGKRDAANAVRAEIKHRFDKEQ